MVEEENSPELTLIRSKSRKRTVALHVETDGRLKVMAPMRTPMAWINAFVSEKAAWIERRRAALALRKKGADLICDGGIVPYMGRGLRLIFAFFQEERGGVRYDETPGELTLYLPQKNREAEAKTELVLWYKKQARKELLSRTSYWISQTGLTPSRVLLSNPKCQWGSCNAKNEIRLNWRLIAADLSLIDYIIVHELCHIRYKSHGVRFWALVEKILPDAKVRRQALRKWEKAYAPSHFP